MPRRGEYLHLLRGDRVDTDTGNRNFAALVEHGLADLGQRAVIGDRSSNQPDPARGLVFTKQLSPQVSDGMFPERPVDEPGRTEPAGPRAAARHFD